MADFRDNVIDGIARELRKQGVYEVKTYHEIEKEYDITDTDRRD